MTTPPIPAKKRRIRTGDRTTRVSIAISPAQHGEVERLAARSGLTFSSYAYELFTAALVNAAAPAAEEEP